jgi:hypothetical protein
MGGPASDHDPIVLKLEFKQKRRGIAPPKLSRMPIFPDLCKWNIVKPFFGVQIIWPSFIRPEHTFSQLSKILRIKVLVGTKVAFIVKVPAFCMPISLPDAALIGNHGIRRC